jgi:hypothetical protein
MDKVTHHVDENNFPVYVWEGRRREGARMREKGTGWRDEEGDEGGMREGWRSGRVFNTSRWKSEMLTDFPEFSEILEHIDGISDMWFTPYTKIHLDRFHGEDYNSVYIGDAAHAGYIFFSFSNFTKFIFLIQIC